MKVPAKPKQTYLLDKQAEQIAALQAELAALRALLPALPVCQGCGALPCVQTEDCPGGRHYERQAAREAASGPQSAFMAYVQSQRGLRAEPIPDDPEAEALDQAAERLAAMHPIDRQAYLEELRAKGRRDDLIAARAASGLDPYSEEELEEMSRGQ